MDTRVFSNRLEKGATLSSAEAGKIRRLRRLFSPHSGRTVIVPVDDSLIFGPAEGLEQVVSKVQKIIMDPPNAILAFPGLALKCCRNHESHCKY